MSHAGVSPAGVNPAGLRVCVFGAGAIGGHVAARLARGGADVSVVARGANLQAMQADGLRVIAKDAEFSARVAATDDPATLGPQDAVLVCTKAPALPSVARSIGPLLGPDTPVVFVINGIPWWYFHRMGGPFDGRTLPLLDPDDALRHALGMERVAGGVVYSACTVVAPGVIEVENPVSNLVLGEPDNTRSERLDAIARLLIAGGMNSEVAPDIREAIWAKLLMNLSGGPIAVLTQASPSGFGVEPAIHDAMRTLMREGIAVAGSLGAHPTIDMDARVARSLTSKHKASILQDLELGRPMEIDGIYTVVQEVARLTGVATPLLDLLLALMKVRARGRGAVRGLTETRRASSADALRSICFGPVAVLQKRAGRVAFNRVTMGAALQLKHVRTIMALLALAAAAPAQAKEWSHVTIATEGAYPPYNLHGPDGKIIGFEVDLANNVCGRVKLTCEFIAQDWDGSIPGLNAGKFDAIMSGMSITAKRLEVIDFSDPYLSAPSTFAVMKDSPLVNMPDTGKRVSLDDKAATDEAIKAITPLLKGKVVGVQISTIQADLLSTYLKGVAEIRTYPTTEQHDLDLEAGRVDAALASTSYFISTLEKPGGDQFKLSGPLFTGGLLGKGVGIALRKSDGDLKALLNKGLAEAKADGTIKTLSVKWFHGDLSPQ